MAKGKKKAAYGRRRGFRLLYQMLSTVLILGAVIGGSILFFRVETIQVVGSSKYSAEQILTAAAVEENANLLLLPERAIEKRIIESFPYVDEVTVKRVFPTTVKLEIHECLPLATVQSDGAWWILDGEGKLLERTEESLASGYIQITGLTLLEPKVGVYAQVEETSEPMYQSLKGILTAVEEVGAQENANWIDVESRTEVNMGYMGRFTVRLPVSSDYGDTNKSNAEYLRKIETLVGMVKKLDELGQGADRGTIDLRGQDGHFIPV